MVRKLTGVEAAAFGPPVESRPARTCCFLVGDGFGVATRLDFGDVLGVAFGVAFGVACDRARGVSGSSLRGEKMDDRMEFIAEGVDRGWSVEVSEGGGGTSAALAICPEPAAVGARDNKLCCSIAEQATGPMNDALARR